MEEGFILGFILKKERNDKPHLSTLSSNVDLNAPSGFDKAIFISQKKQSGHWLLQT
jgi:hypothetical protein